MPCTNVLRLCYHEFVVNRLDDNLLRCVLRDVKAQLEFLLFTVFLNEGRVKARQPVRRSRWSCQCTANWINQLIPVNKKLILFKTIKSSSKKKQQIKGVIVICYLCSCDAEEDNEELTCSLTSPIHLRASVVCILVIFVQIISHHQVSRINVISGQEYKKFPVRFLKVLIN